MIKNEEHNGVKKKIINIKKIQRRQFGLEVMDNAIECGAVRYYICKFMTNDLILGKLYSNLLNCNYLRGKNIVNLQSIF